MTDDFCLLLFFISVLYALKNIYKMVKPMGRWGQTFSIWPAICGGERKGGGGGGRGVREGHAPSSLRSTDNSRFLIKISKVPLSLSVCSSSSSCASDVATLTLTSLTCTPLETLSGNVCCVSENQSWNMRRTCREKLRWASGGKLII